MIRNRLVQAYKQAPWRNRTQKGALFLIGVFLAGCLVWVMLTVSVEASEAGLEIQSMTSEQQNLTREIANLRTNIADETSSTRMAVRAKDLGFRDATAEDLTYVVIPGYAGRRAIVSAPPPGADMSPVYLKPIYTQSLSEWLFEGVLNVSEQTGGLAR
jgi:hypothetical protein